MAMYAGIDCRIRCAGLATVLQYCMAPAHADFTIYLG